MPDAPFSLLASWTLVSILVTTLIGIGFGGLGMSPPQYLLAQISFCISASILVVRVGWWLAVGQSGNFAQRIILAFLIFGTTGALWIWSILWIGGLQPKAQAQNPPTLHGLFSDEFTDGFKMSGEWSISTPTNGVLAKGETKTVWDFDARVKYIAFFVPSCDHSYAASRALINQVDKEFESKQSQLVLQVHGFGTSTDLKDLVFSGRVFLYHADNFTLRQLADLVDLYRAKGMSLEFRGPEYLSVQVSDWHRKHDKKQSAWNIISKG